MAKRAYPREQAILTLTRAELQRLVEMIYLADWVLHAHDTEPSATPAYDRLEQRIMALAYRQGLSSLVEFSEPSKEYVSTEELNEEVRPFIDAYDDNTFWEELSARLAERDAIREIGGEEAYLALPIGERLQLAMRYDQAYTEEFIERGLERLRLAGKDEVA